MTGGRLRRGYVGKGRRCSCGFRSNARSPQGKGNSLKFHLKKNPTHAEVR